MADGEERDFSGERILDQDIEDELKESYLTYSMSVIVQRALPDVRDGLKPSQRRILVSMKDLNLSPRSQHRKCAAIVGRKLDGKDILPRRYLLLDGDDLDGKALQSVYLAPILK